MQLSDYFFLFAGMGLVTYIPRWLPLLYLSHKQLPLLTQAFAHWI